MFKISLKADRSVRTFRPARYPCKEQTVQQPTRVPSARLVNRSMGREAMTDRAWRLIYGGPVEVDQRNVVLLVSDFHYHNKRPPMAMELNALVGKASNISGPTAIKAVKRSVDQKLISMSKAQDDERIRLYWLSDTQLRQIEAVYEIVAMIDVVIAAQDREPLNPSAGADHVPAAVYYNAAHQHTLPEDPNNVVVPSDVRSFRPGPLAHMANVSRIRRDD